MLTFEVPGNVSWASRTKDCLSRNWYKFFQHTRNDGNRAENRILGKHIINRKKTEGRK